MDFASLYNKMEEEAKSPDRFKQQSSFSDPNIYKISKDKDGNGTVTVRFIPSFNKSKTTLNTTVMKKVHNLQWERLLPGKDKPERRWKPEFLCPKTFDKNAECPVCDYGWDMYNELKEAGEPKDKYDVYRTRFTSSEKILTNVMIIKDELRPENNGKIFVYELSKTVYSMFQKEVEKLKEMSPEERAQMQVPEKVQAFDPFDLLCSKNIVLKFKDKKFVSQPSDYWGSSYFTNMFSAVANNIQEAEELVNTAFCLDDYVNESLVPSVDEMNKMLDYVLFRNTKKETKKEVPTEADYMVPQASMADALLKKVQEAPVNVEVPGIPEQPAQTQPVQVQEVEVPQTQPSVATSAGTEVPLTTNEEKPKADAKPVANMSDEAFLASLGLS